MIFSSMQYDSAHNGGRGSGDGGSLGEYPYIHLLLSATFDRVSWLPNKGDPAAAASLSVGVAPLLAVAVAALLVEAVAACCSCSALVFTADLVLNAGGAFMSTTSETSESELSDSLVCLSEFIVVKRSNHNNFLSLVF